MNSKKTEGIEMAISVIDHSQRKAAKVAGFTFLFAIAIVVFSNYSVNFRFVIPNNAVETAKNLIAHETLFRLNVVCDLIYLLTLIVMSTSLYIILKPVNKNLALATIFIRLIYALMWGIMALNIFNALRLLGEASYLPVFDADQLQTLSRLHLSSSWDAYYVGLPFWGLASTVCSYLLFKSRYIPRALAAFGVISSAWCVFCAFIYLIFPNYGEIVHIGLFDVPLTIFEITLGFWLLFKGLRPYGVAQPNKINQ
ncbi:DUF4386 domain-containing protein [bacterium]|nr:DUF4386 domain-containing protein [bacterium]MBU1064242.1 DUF4386 domain-containing protein [bacterium]MBU1634007.1 DUF4386 domain-containing protein [bacterium]